jgi:phosphatidylglycerophosphate synthase
MNEFRKLPDKYEEPISVVMYQLIEFTSNIITNKIHPNIITFSNILLRIYIIYNLQKYIYINIPIYIIFSCFLDYLDGYIARKYNMITKCGDYLDHIGDIIFLIYINYFIITKLNNKYKSKILFILIIFLISNLINLGCQEKYFPSNESETLNTLKPFCFSKKLLNLSKYFGMFSVNFFFGYIFYNHKIYLKN